MACVYRTIGKNPQYADPSFQNAKIETFQFWENKLLWLASRSCRVSTPDLAQDGDIRGRDEQKAKHGSPREVPGRGLLAESSNVIDQFDPDKRPHF